MKGIKGIKPSNHSPPSYAKAAAGRPIRIYESL